MGAFIRTENFSIHYEILGQGSESLLAFPGFNRNADDFKCLEPSLGKTYTIFSFDLFYHGKSEVHIDKYEFTIDELKLFINKFLSENQITTFSLLGYSFGGMLALQIIELFPEPIKDVYLLAPYGVQPGRWIRWGEKLKLSKKIFYSLIKKPDPFFIAIRLLFASGLITKRKFEFMQHQMGSESRRKALFDVWNVYFKIRPEIKNVCDKINSKKINLHLFYGEFDPIEPPSKANYMISHLNMNNRLHVVPLTHDLVCDKMNTFLKPFVPSSH